VGGAPLFSKQEAVSWFRRQNIFVLHGAMAKIAAQGVLAKRLVEQRV
jgi:hypothetical protein